MSASVWACVGSHCRLLLQYDDSFLQYILGRPSFSVDCKNFWESQNSSSSGLTSGNVLQHTNRYLNILLTVLLSRRSAGFPRTGNLWTEIKLILASPRVLCSWVGGRGDCLQALAVFGSGCCSCCSNIPLFTGLRIICFEWKELVAEEIFASSRRWYSPYRVINWKQNRMQYVGGKKKIARGEGRYEALKLHLWCLQYVASLAYFPGIPQLARIVLHLSLNRWR